MFDSYTEPQKLLDSQQAEELAAWHSIQVDLRKIIVWLEMLLTEIDEGIPDFTICSERSLAMESLWSSAVIFYARCFRGGKRISLDPSIFSRLDGEPLKAHNWYIGMRNKRIAHSVNAYEQYHTALIAPLAKGRYEVKGIKPASLSHVYPDAEGCKTLSDFAKVACNHATGRIRELTQLVIEQAENLTQDEIKKLKNIRFTGPHPSTVDQDR